MFTNLPLKKHTTLTVGITSTSFITGTGLKKWRPPNLSLRCVLEANSVTEREDVLLAKMAELQKYSNVQAESSLHKHTQSTCNRMHLKQDSYVYTKILFTSMATENMVTCNHSNQSA